MRLVRSAQERGPALPFSNFLEFPDDPGKPRKNLPASDLVPAMIIDTHVHYYDPTREGGAPWPDPKDTVIYLPTYPDRCEALAAPCGVTGTIMVECSECVVQAVRNDGSALHDPTCSNGGFSLRAGAGSTLGGLWRGSNALRQRLAGIRPQRAELYGSLQVGGELRSAKGRIGNGEGLL